MICLCYSKEKGLFIEEKHNEVEINRYKNIIFKSYENKGFIDNSPVSIGDKFKFQISSNFGFFKASYLVLSIKYDGKPVLNFDSSLHEKRGMRRDTVGSFFFDAESAYKWEKLFKVIIDVYNMHGKYSYYGIMQYIGDICNELRDDSYRLQSNDNVLLKIYNGKENLPYRYCDLISHINNSDLKEKDIIYEREYKSRLNEKAIMYIKAAERYMVANNCNRELQYKVVRNFADIISKEDSKLREELQKILLRKIDKCISLSQIGTTDIWYGQYNPLENFQLEHPNENSLLESSHFEGVWMFIDNSVDEYLKTADGVESVWTLLPSKSPDNDVFTISHEKDRYKVLRLVDSKLQEIELGDTYTKVGGFNHNVALVQKGNKFGIVDINGNIVVDVKYDYIADFYQNWSDVIRLDKDGVILQKDIKSLIENKQMSEKKNSVLNGTSLQRKDCKEDILPLAMPIKNVECKNFKRYKELKPLTISQVNFIVGANNVGKSTYLDLVDLLMHDLPLIETGFSSFDEFQAIKIGVRQNGHPCWGHNGINNIISDDKKITAELELDAFNLLNNKSNPEDIFAIRIVVGNVAFSFTLSKENKKSYYEISNLSEDLILKYTGSKTLTLSSSKYGEIIRESYNKTDTNDLGTIIEHISYHVNLLVNRLTPEALEQCSTDIKQFVTNIYIAISSTTQVEHLSWSGDVDLPSCRKYFDTESNNINNAVLATIRSLKGSITEEESNEILERILNARDKIIIPFINKWLEKFEIGNFFSLHLNKDPEKHKVRFNISKGVTMLQISGFTLTYLDNIKHSINPMLDKSILDETIYINGFDDIRAEGTGTKHLISLIFTISRMMLENIMRDITLPILLVEEPEQNLHPKWQSLLADFFWDVTRVQKSVLKEYGMSGNKDIRELQIIVETHSEYLIRKTQLYAKAYSTLHEGEKVPFSTFYFPKEGNPYDMKYKSNGQFKEAFGKGFYDEAANLAYQINIL